MAHRPKPKKTGVGRSGASRYQAALKKWEAEHKAGAKAPTEKDKADAKKEKDTANLPKPKLKSKTNGTKTNGTKTNGTKTNGTKTNGTKTNGTKTNGTKTNGTKTNGTKTNGTKTNGTKKDKLKVTGKGPVASGKEYGKHLDARKKKMDAKAAAEEKAAWLKKTKRSPAARAGFSDDERWALQQKHRQWKADRKAGKLKKKPLTRAERMKRRR